MTKFISYLFISVSTVLKVSLSFHFLQNPSFITLGVCTLCGQQHHCPAVIPIVVKALLLEWIIYKIFIKDVYFRRYPCVMDPILENNI